MSQALDDLKAAQADQASAIQALADGFARVESDFAKLRDQANAGVSPADLATLAEGMRANTAKIRAQVDAINVVDPEPVDETPPVVDEPVVPAAPPAPVDPAPVDPAPATDAPAPEAPAADAPAASVDQVSPA